VRMTHAPAGCPLATLPPQSPFPRPSVRTGAGDKSLELLQYHFHTPSEHTIDGIHSSMEVHLVHKNTKTGGLCVLG
jgi:carbonic anhydrase